MIRLFIGYDTREPVAWHAMVQSIIDHTSAPVSITPLALGQLGRRLTRPRDPRQSTDFAFSRFLVPQLCDFDGWALFMDCDMLVLDDLAALWALRDERYAVQVVQHDHQPPEDTKFLGQRQTRYEKKNWSSVMLFNNARCTALDRDYVNRASGLELHQFKWLGDDSLIGSLPSRWNHLVGYDAPREDVAVLHYTTGGPWFDTYKAVEYASLWHAYRARAEHAGNRAQDAGSGPAAQPNGTDGR